MLLTADLHLDDNPDNEYRWKVFESLAEHAPYGGQVAILGDMTNNRNRFSNTLVNRLVTSLKELHTCGCDVYILMGNHDAPVNGPPFWSFLNSITGIHYIHEPTYSHKDRLWLPYSSDPERDWKDVDWTRSRVAFLHQFMDGSIIRGNKMSGQKLALPGNVVYYAGDVHDPQQVGDVLYVGAPHPVDFGDHYACRLLLLHDDYQIRREIVLDPPKKMSITIQSFTDLDQLKGLRDNDKIKVNYILNVSDVSQAPSIEAMIQVWAMTNKVNAHVNFSIPTQLGEVGDMLYFDSAIDVLIAFASYEKLAGNLLEVGKTILKNARK